MWGWQRAAPSPHAGITRGIWGYLWGETSLTTALTPWASLVGKASAREGVMSVPTLGWNDAGEGSGRDPEEGLEQPWFIHSWPSMLEMCLTFL